MQDKREELSFDKNKMGQTKPESGYKLFFLSFFLRGEIKEGSGWNLAHVYSSIILYDKKDCYVYVILFAGEVGKTRMIQQ